MKFYPVNINIQDKKCVVVGGGKIAYDKIIGLLEAGANVEVIAPEICPQLEKISDKVKIVRENYSAEKISDGVILIAATNNAELNAQIAADGHAKHFLVNIVDDISSDFIVPSRIRRGDFLLAISTGGSSPAFSKFVREMLEREFSSDFGEGLKIISHYRQEVKKHLQNHEDRKNFWRENLTPEMWELLKNGELEKVEAKIKNALESVGNKL